MQLVLHQPQTDPAAVYGLSVGPRHRKAIASLKQAVPGLSRNRATVIANREPDLLGSDRLRLKLDDPIRG